MAIDPTEPIATPLTPATPSQAAATSTRRKRGFIDWLLAGAAILAIGGVAFAVGRSTAPVAAAGFPTFPGSGVTIQPRASGDPGTGPQGGLGPGPAVFGGKGPTIEGTVTSIDADSITIRLASGDEITVATDGETTYHESTATDPGSVRIGDDVDVRVEGGRFAIRGNGQGTPGQGDQDGAADPGTVGGDGLTADDVTVRRQD